MAEVVRTNFAPIFLDFENFRGTNRSANYTILKLLYPLVRAFILPPPNKKAANPV